ncbi:hypothetical protein GCM10022267_88270 [Lentzea roselyniae]|uniref:Uncharacterized protein n=1 Tax=Lentzea roselyniae TaxID=531940 RepID=A0ABP7CD44_9PSEU
MREDPWKPFHGKLRDFLLLEMVGGLEEQLHRGVDVPAHFRVEELDHIGRHGVDLDRLQREHALVLALVQRQDAEEEPPVRGVVEALVELVDPCTHLLLADAEDLLADVDRVELVARVVQEVDRLVVSVDDHLDEGITTQTAGQLVERRHGQLFSDQPRHVGFLDSHIRSSLAPLQRASVTPGR